MIIYKEVSDFCVKMGKFQKWVFFNGFFMFLIAFCKNWPKFHVFEQFLIEVHFWLKNEGSKSQIKSSYINIRKFNIIDFRLVLEKINHEKTQKTQKISATDGHR